MNQSLTAGIGRNGSSLRQPDGVVSKFAFCTNTGIYIVSARRARAIYMPYYVVCEIERLPLSQRAEFSSGPFSTSMEMALAAAARFRPPALMHRS